MLYVLRVIYQTRLLELQTFNPLLGCGLYSDKPRAPPGAIHIRALRAGHLTGKTIILQRSFLKTH